MSRRVRRAVRCAILACGVILTGCGDPSFHRVEQFPQGVQIDPLSSGMASRSHTSHVSDRYKAPYARVWAATERVARRMEQMGVRPVLLVEAEKGEMRLRETRTLPSRGVDYDPDDLRLEGWIDEFVFTVVTLGPDRTKVTVARTVRGIPAFQVCAFVVAACAGGLEPEVSNGIIEDWLLTQIEDDLAAQH